MEHEVTGWPALYFDTETADYHERSSPALPVQVAAILATENRVVTTLSCIISQRHWQGIRQNPIAQRVIDIHGITPEVCDAYGWPPDFIIGRFRQMLSIARVVVAHNIQFDLSVMDNVCDQQQVPKLEWPEQFCTMRESAAIVGIQSRGGYSIGGFKAPKLREAYHHFARKDITNANDALADAYACRFVHRGILKHRAATANPPVQPPDHPVETPPGDATGPEQPAPILPPPPPPAVV
jgi:DNA polymerase-3 subunit epsilon